MKIDVISFFIIDDHHLVCQSLGPALERVSQQSLRFVGYAINDIGLWEELKKANPALLLLDINLDNLDGMTLLPDIRKRFPKIKIIMLTHHNNQQYVTHCLDMGAKGYVLKTATNEKLANAMKQVVYGNVYIDDELKNNRLSEIIQTDTQKLQERYNLTPREAQILIMITQGKTNKQIAKELHLAETTIETHRRNMKTKLKAPTLADMIRLMFD